MYLGYDIIIINMYYYHYYILLYVIYKIDVINKIEYYNKYDRKGVYKEDNIRMDLEEIGINAGNWVDSAHDRNYWRALVNAALNLRVP